MFDSMNRLPPFGSDVRLRLASTGWESDPRAAEPLAIVWSGPDPDGAIHRLLDYVEALPDDIDLLADEVATRRVAHLAGLSKELMRQLVRHPQWLFGADEDLLSLARSTLIQVAGDDGAGVIDVTEGTRLLSEMADRVVERALAEESPVGGPPLAVIAMGKWGGTELNYWSDIDLLFAFEGGSAEAALATRTAASLLRKLSNGPDGAVLRADPDLRPEGSRGPLARSIEAYRSYYERWAEPWEFQALLKARWAAGDRGVGEHFQELVEEVLWPETLNPDTVRSIRILKARVEAGADPGDIKRSPGGIRDIEFAVQMLQLVHGRFDEDLRQTGTLGLLEALADGGYVDPDDAVVLAESYRWLRALEHRLQLWELRPTQILPTDAEERDRLARAMGYRDTAGSTARESFEQDLVTHRSRVRRIHEALYFRPLLEAFAATPTTGLSREGAELRLQALGFRDVARAVRTFESLTSGLSRRSRLMQQMLPLILDWLADAPDPDLGLDQLRLLAANMPDHAELITTLHDRPVVGQRLALLLGSSRLLGRYLDRIPEFVPDLDDDRKLTDLRPKDELERRLRQRLAARPESEHLGTLRRFARRQFIRVAARDLLGMADVERTMADLTAAADAAVAAAVDLIGRDGFAVIAMGGWGGMEMSYASDLDLMYVHDGRLESSAASARATQLRRLLTDRKSVV